MGNRWISGLVYLIIIAAAIALIFNQISPSNQREEVLLSQLLEDAREGEIELIEVGDDQQQLNITYKDGRQAISRKEPQDSLHTLLQDAGVSQMPTIEVSGPSLWSSILGPLSYLVLPLVFLFVLFFFLRQAQGNNNQAISFGKSRARLFTGDKPKITFADVAAVDEAKQELNEVVEFLKYPEKFAALGARIPRGVLLMGPPGTGKTLLARAVAGEAGVPFFSISGSEFVEMFVGVGASRVRDLFDQAKRNAPAIVFIDEIDAVGRQRGTGLGGSHDEREQTLNQILVEMDGFDTSTNVIIVAATNRPDILDPALLRPGRFDRRVVLDRPDMRGRMDILQVHVRGKPLAANLDLEVLARQTPGFSGADLANMVNEAAILAARRNKKQIGMDELEEAAEKVVAGPERKSRRISEEEKQVIAYHEAGHALVAHMIEECDPVHKVSVVSRGMALGYTMALPEEDRYLMPRPKILADMAYAMGGYAAEKLIFDELTSGSQNDIERATKMARRMVTQFGMSEELGPVTYGQKEELVFLGREISEQRDYSDSTARLIDDEVRRIVESAYQRAGSILEQHRAVLEQVAQRLIEVETLEGQELQSLLNQTRQPAQSVEVYTPA
ncbi:MAG: ATP-dependent zinc metalloprotease FtsH [Chloroflexia bacterium]|nr:ATP-dependent zinc metalloprotease FtsH [Chloroflexia bacterium]